MKLFLLLLLSLTFGCQEKSEISDIWHGRYGYVISYENCLATVSTPDTTFYSISPPTFLLLNDTTDRFMLFGMETYEGVWALEEGDGTGSVHLLFDDSLFSDESLMLRSDGSLVMETQDSICSSRYTVFEAPSPLIDDKITPVGIQKTLSSGIWKVELPTQGTCIEFVFDSAGRSYVAQFFSANTILPTVHGFGHFIGNSWYYSRYLGEGSFESFTIRFLGKVSEDEFLIDFYNSPNQLITEASSRKIRMFKQRSIEKVAKQSKKEMLYGTWKANRHPLANGLPNDRYYKDDYLKIVFDSSDFTLSWGGQVIFKDSANSSDRNYKGSWQLGANGKFISLWGADAKDPVDAQLISFEFFNENTIQMRLYIPPVSNSERYPYRHTDVTLYKKNR